jgi:predicted ATPase/transposase/transcriptional regulator with XRE-family HTH domain
MDHQILTNQVWCRIELLLPEDPPKPQGGRPHIANRMALSGILHVLKLGIPWKELPRDLGFGTGMSCLRRLQEWECSGTWAEVSKILLEHGVLAESVIAERTWVSTGSRVAVGPLVAPRKRRARGRAGERSGAPAVQQQAVGDDGHQRFARSPNDDLLLQGWNLQDPNSTLRRADLPTHLPFGVWLKHERKALDLTQESLARRIGCSAVTIRKIEAGSLKPSRQVAELMAATFTTDTAKQSAIIQWSRGLVREMGMLPRHLPLPPTSFVGREHEVKRVLDRLRQPEVRLVTLTGPPGIGKTRLALHVADDLQDEFAHGVAFVPLAGVRDPDLVASSIAQSLHTWAIAYQPLAEQLDSYLQNKHLLLVLDNFEQVAPAAFRIANLLLAAPRLKILVTSREPLHVYGEHDISVQPLTLPDSPDPLPPDQLAEVPAIRLFLQRTQAVKPDFEITSENALAVTAICTHMDGLPLAIELAAARSRIFSPQAMFARLSDRFTLLTGGPRNLPVRQQTLRSAIDWSYQLLDPAEQRLFRRLAVFAGGCTAEAAQSVCNMSDDLPVDILECLVTLVDKSLLQQREGLNGEPRFWMLETLQEYSREWLVESGEQESMQRRHASYYVALAEAAAAHIDETGRSPWLDSLEQEHDNLLALLDWALGCREVELVVRLRNAVWEAGMGLAIARVAVGWKR